MSGLGHNNSSIFLNINDGKIVRRFKEPTQYSRSRILQKGPNVGKEVHEEMYDYVSGVIKDIVVKSGDYGKSWNITINGDGIDYVLQLDYSSGYSSAFLKTLPNITDFSKEVKISPKVTLADGGKKKATLFVNQGGKAIKWYYTKDNPNGLPDMRQLVVRNEKVWDDTDMMLFLEDMVNRVIRPKLGVDSTSTSSHLDDKTRDDVNGFVPDDQAPPLTSDDAPF